MRRDHRPYWMHRLWEWRENAYTRRRISPRFDQLGAHTKIVRPWHLEVFGRGITAGDCLHVIASRDAPVRLTVWPGPDREGELVIGDCVLITGGVRLLAARSIRIGHGCMFAKDATVTDCDWHGLYDRTAVDEDARPVVLEDNVWVADGAFVGKGVTVGCNSIIGARAVVTKDVPANVVVAGNPAQVVKALDPDMPMRTRMDMLKDPDGVGRFMDGAYKAMLQGNSTVGWLKSRFFPGRND